MRQARNEVVMLLVVLDLALGSCSTSPPAPVGKAPSASPAPVGKALAVSPTLGKAPSPASSDVSKQATPVASLTDDQRILHVLDRLGYGPRPGDLDRVKRIGLTAYIEQQLDPRRIPDEAADRALADYRTLVMSTPALVREYPRPTAEAMRQRADGQMSASEMMEAFPLARRPNRIVSEMQAAKIARAVLSERQLEEVMVDFWMNHFNVYARKGPVVWMLPSYERNAIRPHALGRFRDLLVATARHPAMLYYLDNWRSTRAGLVAQQGPNKGRTLGLNENYGRELMELHTLGVDGGYSQQDVIEVARCFTGWTIDRPLQGGGFVFRPRAHDQGEKHVLGHGIPAGGGEQDGMQVIDLLARHPSTARFISAKLVRRFVSDDPPPATVERAAAVFRQTDGDIRAVLAAIFSSDEFFAAQAYRAKIKTPLELVVSAVRAVGASVDRPGSEEGALSGGAFTLARQVAKLGEPLYEAQAPTGYPDSAEAWVNTGALLGRMNFSLALAQERLPGVHVDLTTTLAGTDPGQPTQVLDRLSAVALHGEMTGATRGALLAQLDDPEVAGAQQKGRVSGAPRAEKLAALILGSPEFQRR